MNPRSRPTPAVLAAAIEVLCRDEHRGVLVVQGQSMRPTIESGARVELEFGTSTPSFGDIILFRQHDSLVLHRFLGRVRERGRAESYLARGDGLSRLDPPIPPSAVLGRVTVLEHRSGWRAAAGLLPRAYARMMGVHGLFWAMTVQLLARLGRPFETLAVRSDRFLLRTADHWLFAKVHPSTTSPLVRSVAAEESAPRGTNERREPNR